MHVSTRLQHSGAKGLRDDLAQLINNPDRDQELEWGRIFSLLPDQRAAELAVSVEEHGCKQIEDQGVLVWLNDQSLTEAAFFFVSDPAKPQEFLEIYRMVEAADLPLAFVVVPEPLNQGTFHVFTVSRESSMAHSWRVGLKGDVPTPPIDKRIRRDLFELFRIHAERPELTLSDEEMKEWANALRSSRGHVVAKLKEAARRLGCTQEADGDFIVWLGPSGSSDAVFYVAEDPTDRKAFISIYERIVSEELPLTYVFVQQEEDVWDLFWLSAGWYLRHCCRPSWGPNHP